MELQQVRYFLALARTLNFTRAAEQCNVTQPALTKAIQKLEFELGGALVYRERNLTQLTQLGALVLPMFERTFAAAEAALSHAAEYGKKRIAPLRIGLGPGVSAKIVAVPLRELAKTVPGLALELIDTPLEKISSSLLEGCIDALIAGDVKPDTCDRFDCWHLFDERLVVLMPCGHPLAIYDTVPPDQLIDATWLEFAGCEARQTAWERWKGPNAECASAHRAPHPFQLLPLVAAGMGLLLAPQHLPLIEGITARFVDDPELQRPVFLVAVAGRRHPPSLGALIKIMRTHNWAHDLGFKRRLTARNQEQLAYVA